MRGAIPWRRVFAPEVIFGFSAAAALFPYVLWRFGYGMPAAEHIELTYIPVVVWACGFVSFLVGARLAPGRLDEETTFRLSQENMPMALLLSFASAIALAQVYLAIQDVYGVLPLLDYLSSSGNFDVVMANDQQQYSGSGQLGMLTASLYALNSIFLVAILQRVTWRRGSRVVLAALFLVVGFAHLINAKRGGLYSTIFYLLVGLSIYFGDPVRGVAALLPGRSRIVTKGVLVAVPVGLIFAFGYIASIRTRGRVEDGTGEILSYLQLPLINFETQCRAAGLGPGDFRLLGPFRFLAPYKYMELDDSFAVTAPRAIRDSPAGMYEEIHWCWGMPGVIGYSLLLGLVSRWLYNRSLRSLTCLLSYCYLAVALALAHTANQVLILAYVPVPLVCTCLLKAVVFTEPVRPASSRARASRDGFVVGRSPLGA